MERKSARKRHKTSDSSGGSFEDVEDSDSETKVVAATSNAWKKKWTKSAAPTTKLGPRWAMKSLAQYAHHDEKGAVRGTPPAPTYTPYPYNERVGQGRVLAQYPHHDDKWAVKHPVH